MRSLIFMILCLGLASGSYAQQKVVYTIPADSVKLSYCDSSELIIENHTQNVPGFLYNTGRGRTIFKRGAQRLGNGSYLIGSDTVKAWMQGGNAFGATGILGTLDSNHLDFYTNSNGNARLTNTGNFLLGSTTDNGAKLQVNGGTWITGTTWLGSTTYMTGLLNYVNQGLYDFNAASAQLNFPGDGSVGISSGITTGVRRLTVSNSGNIGVGTASPAAQLHTTGTVRFAGLTSDTTQTRVIVSDANGNLFYRTVHNLVANEPVRSSLAVNGPIRAKKLTLLAKDWPDYVFDSSYVLMPLPELKEYIRRNSHLPGIVPAAAAEDNGVDVGNTQAALLKKIEELTLYTIKQDQEIEFLKTETSQLRKLITAKSANKQ